jgi:hypothetical protein
MAYRHISTAKMKIVLSRYVFASAISIFAFPQVNVSANCEL